MERQVLFIQGAGDRGYETDKKLVTSLRSALGKEYTIHYPEIHTNDRAADFEWPLQIHKAILSFDGDVVLMGHSLGASMLLRTLSKTKVKKRIAGIFLLATPYWSGDEAWKKGLM